MMGFEPASRPRAKAACASTEKYGVKVCSIGFALPRGTPVVWRGPMIGTAVRELPAQHPLGRARLPARRPAAGHLRRIHEHGAGSADLRRRRRQHAAGHRARRCHQSRRHVRQAASSRLRHHREHELLHAPDTGDRYEIFGHGGARWRPRSWAWSSSAKSRWIPATRQAATRARRSSAARRRARRRSAFIEVARQVAARCSVLEYAAGA